MLNAMLLLACLMAGSPAPQNSPPQETLTPATLPAYLDHYSGNFQAVEVAYSELAGEKLSLRDEAGQPMTRRHIEDRRKSLAELRQTTRQLAARPTDLVLALTLMTQTEELADDLYDLAQIAYDNDREELGRHFADLQVTMDGNKDRLQSYVLDLAAQTASRLQQLEKENARLEDQLKTLEHRP